MSNMFTLSPLERAFAALRKDLIHEDGPRISTMRNYSFAIVPYRPQDEFKTRQLTQRLTTGLRESGWVVLTISLQKLLLERIRRQGDEWVARVMATEARLAARSPDRGLKYLKGKLLPLIEESSDLPGLASDVAALIQDHADREPSTIGRTVVFIGRAGALHPFFRSSALLRHLDGKTRNIPIVLLYPGEQTGPTSLSFMGLLDADNDYRPRIYDSRRSSGS